MVILFRGVGVVEVGGGSISLILFIGFFPFIPQINFLDPVGYLVNRSVPDNLGVLYLGVFS